MNTTPDSRPILRFPGHEHSDLPLAQGMNGLCRDPDFDRGLMLTPHGAASLIDFCADARGLWLHVGEGVQGIHVNGRPVQRLAFLHLGDSIHCDGVEMRLVDRDSREVAHAPAHDERGAPLPQPVLRGLCGRDHGRAFALDHVVRIGGRGAEIRPDGIDGPLAEVFWRDGEVWLRAEDADTAVRVNAEVVRTARLKPGDQLMFAPGSRYVLESAGKPPINEAAVVDTEYDQAPAIARGGRRVPWLLLAAIASAAALAALLWFGVR